MVLPARYTWETPQADISMDGITEGTTIGRRRRWPLTMVRPGGPRAAAATAERPRGERIYNDTTQQYQR